MHPLLIIAGMATVTGVLTQAIINRQKALTKEKDGVNNGLSSKKQANSDDQSSSDSDNSVDSGRSDTETT